MIEVIGVSRRYSCVALIDRYHCAGYASTLYLDIPFTYLSRAEIDHGIKLGFTRGEETATHSIE